jgi:hypothetical protein
VDNFQIGKLATGGGGEGKRRMVHYRGTLSSECGLDDISKFVRNLGYSYCLAIPLILVRIAYKGFKLVFLIQPKEIV